MSCSQTLRIMLEQDRKLSTNVLLFSERILTFMLDGSADLTPAQTQGVHADGSASQTSDWQLLEIRLQSLEVASDIICHNSAVDADIASNTERAMSNTSATDLLYMHNARSERG